MNRKKLILLFLVLFTFLVSKAYAAVQILAAAALGALLIGGAVYSIYKPAVPSGPQHYVSPSGAIGRSAVAAARSFNQWGQEQFQGQMGALRANFNSLKDYLTSNPSAAPSLRSAMFRADTPYATASPGSIIKGANGTYYKVTSSENPVFTTSAPDNASRLAYYNGRFESNTPVGPAITYVAEFALGEIYIRLRPVVEATQSEISSASSNPVSPSDFATAIKNPDNSVKTEFSGDIDALIQSQPNIFSFVDTANPGQDLDSAPPAILPPPAPSVVDPANPAVTGLGAGQATATAGKAATSAAAAQAARAIADAAKAASAANPSDPALKAAADQAEEAAKKAEDAAKLATDAATKAQADTETQFPNATSEQLKEFDWSKFLQLKDAMSNVWPFTLLTSIPQLLGSFVREPAAPVFHLPVFGNDMTVDLAIFDPVALVVRWVFSVLGTVGVVFCLVNWYRGGGV